MHKSRSYAEVINDKDGDVVNLFRVMRDPTTAAELERQIRLTPYSREEFDNAYNPTEDPIERARRLLTRAFMGFGSASHNMEKPTGFRGDCRRTGTTPAHDWANYPDYMSVWMGRLRGVVIENRDAVQTIQTYDGPDTLIYADPPYPRSTRSMRNDAYSHEMTDPQHVAMIETLKTLTSMVVLSGYSNEMYKDLLSDWKELSRGTQANGQTGSSARTEVLWFNQAAWDARPQAVMEF